MTLSKDELAKEKKDLKQYEMHTGLGMLDGPLNSIDVDKDGRPDIPVAMREYAKYKPFIEAGAPLIEEVLPLLSKEKLAKLKDKLVAFVKEELADPENQAAVQAALFKGLDLVGKAVEAAKK